MKTIIAGSRTIVDINIVEKAIKDSGFDITEVVCGEARGVDSLGKKWAIHHNIPVASFPAAWDVHGRSAGFIRNREMAAYGEALIAIWDGKSKGTASMISLANKAGLTVYVHKEERKII